MSSYLLCLVVLLSGVVLLRLLGGSRDLPLALLELLGGWLRRHFGGFGDGTLGIKSAGEFEYGGCVFLGG